MANQESHGFILSSWERNGCGWEAEIMLIKHTKERSFNASLRWQKVESQVQVLALLLTCCVTHNSLSVLV